MRGKEAMNTHARSVGWALLGMMTAAAGCASPARDVLTSPSLSVAPYDTSRGEVLWAVAPLRNESGTSEADPEAMGDKVVAAVEEIQGVRCVPLNRTIAAMAALGMRSLSTPADARKLAQAMGVDGVVVGSITAYDPYTPTLGLALALYARPGAMTPAADSLDTRALTAAPSDAGRVRGSGFADAPLAVASEHLDAKNHQVLLDVKAYAQGRQKTPSALGWRRYTASMDLYGEFAAHRMVDALIKQEWVRTSVAGVPSEGSEFTGR